MRAGSLPRQRKENCRTDALANAMPSARAEKPHEFAMLTLFDWFSSNQRTPGIACVPKPPAPIAGNACAPNPPIPCIAVVPIIGIVDTAGAPICIGGITDIAAGVAACIIGTAVSTIVGIAVGTICTVSTIIGSAIGVIGYG